MKTGIYLLILFLVSCTSNKSTQEKKDTTTASNQTQAAISSLEKIDSLRDYRSYYYLSNLSTRDFAELYLKDSIMTNDYKKLYDCLDSLSSNNPDTRNFYFKVLIYALDNPEVVFHQSMGVYLVKNIDKFRTEFLMRLSNMTEREIVIYAEGIEGYLSTTQDKGEKWINDLKLLEENSTPEQLKNLKLLFIEIEKSRNSTMQ